MNRKRGGERKEDMGGEANLPEVGYQTDNPCRRKNGGCSEEGLRRERSRGE